MPYYYGTYYRMSDVDPEITRIFNMAKEKWSKPQLGEMSRDKIVPSVKHATKIDRALRDSGSLEEARDKIKDVADKSRKDRQ